MPKWCVEAPHGFDNEQGNARVHEAGSWPGRARRKRVLRRHARPGREVAGQPLPPLSVKLNVNTPSVELSPDDARQLANYVLNAANRCEDLNRPPAGRPTVATPGRHETWCTQHVPDPDDDGFCVTGRTSTHGIRVELTNGTLSELPELFLYGVYDCTGLRPEDAQRAGRHDQRAGRDGTALSPGARRRKRRDPLVLPSASPHAIRPAAVPSRRASARRRHRRRGRPHPRRHHDDCAPHGPLSGQLVAHGERHAHRRLSRAEVERVAVARYRRNDRIGYPPDPTPTGSPATTRPPSSASRQPASASSPRAGRIHVRDCTRRHQAVPAGAAAGDRQRPRLEALG